jgi:ankyrin repeat protein
MVCRVARAAGSRKYTTYMKMELPGCGNMNRKDSHVTLRRVSLVVGILVVVLLVLAILDKSEVGVRRDRAFCDAASGGNIRQMRLLLLLHADVNRHPGGKLPPLQCASFGGQVEAVRFLLAHGADVNQKDKFGNTALDIAYSQHHDEIVKVLIAAGGVRTHSDGP